jgi:hypothetical protein
MIVCYLPGPDVFRRILPELRRLLLAKYVAEKVIDRELAKEFSANF